MLRHHAFPDGLTREQLLEWFRATRARTRSLFDLIPSDAYYERPISLRNPLVFYEGHLPAFAVNTLLKLTLKREGVDEQLERIFERGIDPVDETSVRSPTDVWPSRAEVQAYAAAAEAKLEETLANAPIGEAVFTVIEHELMHQETLLYMIHSLGRQTAEGGPRDDARAPKRESIAIPRGIATLGMPRGGFFGWDNEFPELRVDVDAFAIDSRNVTNGEYLEFVEATGAQRPHFWTGDLQLRGLLSLQPLPMDAPVYVTHDEAAAYANWRGARLPSEAEFHRAAYGTPEGEERMHPWGNEPADATRGNFDFASWDPVTAGSFPNGASAWGVLDLVGNGWEWTSSLFRPFPGFAPMPSYLPYSADFFDDAHYVLKGASPVTPRELVRRTFRNWFRPNYPYMYATFRCMEEC